MNPILGIDPLDFVAQYKSHPEVDPRVLTEATICLGHGARQYLLQDQPAVQSSCILPRTINRGATCDPSLRPSIQKRGIDEDWDTTAPSCQQRPSIGFMLKAILNNRFTFQYTRLIGTRDFDDSVAGPQGLVELAWLMGPNIRSVDPLYQGENNNPPDLFFVMHFHVDHTVRANNRNLFPGIFAVNAFHGQFVNNRNRVDGNSGRNQRTQRTNVLECEGRYRGETLAQRYWYPGYTPANGNNPSEVLWEQFGAYIRQNNFLTGNTLNPVVRAQDNDPDCNLFDWAQIDNDSGSFTPGGGQYHPPT
ncbi:hypothetical protein MMC31_005392 [Peltigera leucophlebia]|nr:hypothetical protein [Peltigera leucophlebia]